MTDAPAIPDPKRVAGIALIVFGGWLALEGALMLSVGHLFVAGNFVGLGWFFRKRGTTEFGGCSSVQQLWRWMRFCAAAAPVLVAAYVLGYLILMDRHRPTSPSAEFVRFESSFRLAPREWVHKAQVPYRTPWGSVTTWNLLYQPMDRLWFRYFPRSQEEIETLRLTELDSISVGMARTVEARNSLLIPTRGLSTKGAATLKPGPSARELRQ